MKREDFKTYAASLRDKSAKFKLKKAQIAFGKTRQEAAARCELNRGIRIVGFHFALMFLRTSRNGGLRPETRTHYTVCEDLLNHNSCSASRDVVRLATAGPNCKRWHKSAYGA